MVLGYTAACNCLLVKLQLVTSLCRFAVFFFFLKLYSKLFLPQHTREESVVTPHKTGSCIENALHKDVFGVISGTGKASLCFWTNDTTQRRLNDYLYLLKAIFSFSVCFFFFFAEASPHSSTPNVSSVHADSRGSLVSTDSGNSLLDKNSDKTNSLEKVTSYLNNNSALHQWFCSSKCPLKVVCFHFLDNLVIYSTNVLEKPVDDDFFL